MNEDEITWILREYDPAAGRELDPGQAARMKGSMLAATGETRPAPWRPVIAALAAMVVFVIATLLVSPPKTDPAPMTTHSVANEPMQPAEASENDSPTVRQIQYTTEGGTRIIWTLDPNFQL